MKTIYELQQIANRLRQVMEVNSISPEDTFGLQSDVLEYLADMEQNAEGLGIHKVYASYAAMVADASSPVGSNGKALRFGQLVVICNPSNTIQEENGNIYAWQKGNAGDAAWLLIGNLGSVLGDPQNGYYVCDTAAATAEKEISATSYVLSVGGSMKVKMTNANTADNATLNINSTGVKALYYAGERASSINTWEAGETVEVYYDGTSYYANNVAGGSGSGDGAFDVSAKYPTSGVDGSNTYTLGGALAVLNANLSANKKKGGMSIKFIQSSDNKYVQFTFLLSGSFTDSQFTNVNNWQSMNVDNEPIYNSNNLVKSGGIRDYIEQISGESSSVGELFASNSTINKVGQIISGINGYNLYKYEITERTNFVYYKIGVEGSNLSLVYGYNSNDEPVKRFEFATASGTYEGIINLSQELNISYILFCRYRYGGAAYDVLEIKLSDVLKSKFLEYFEKSKIVSSFQTTSDNNHVPSELLVRSQLNQVNGRLDKIEDYSFLGETNIQDQFTLYQSNSIIANGNIISISGYDIYKLEIPNLNKAVINFIFSNQTGTNLPLIYAYKSDGTVISEVLRLATPGTVSYQFKGSDYPTVQYLLINVERNTLSASQVDITTESKTAIQDNYNGLYKENVINVSPTATGANSLISILASLMDRTVSKPSETNRYRIVLSAGDYNMDCSELTLIDEFGIYIIPYTTIEGKGQGITNLIFRYNGNDDNIMSKYSTLNMPYTSTLKNLSVIAKNIRYAIHSDGGMTGYTGASYSNICLENVDVIHEGHDDGLTPTFKIPAAWGGGSRDGGHLTFKNCVFNSYNCSAFANHDVAYLTVPSIFEFENCDFISGSLVNTYTDFINSHYPSVWLNSWGSNIKIKCYFKNCRYNKYVILNAEQTYNQNCKIDYDIMFDNEPIVLMNTANGTDKDCHYVTASSIKMCFESQSAKGIPVKYEPYYPNKFRNATTLGANESSKFAGILMQNVGANEFGVVQRKGYIPMQLTLGTTFSAGKMIGWDGSNWVEDNNNPILRAISNEIAEILT